MGDQRGASVPQLWRRCDVESALMHANGEPAPLVKYELLEAYKTCVMAGRLDNLIDLVDWVDGGGLCLVCSCESCHWVKEGQKAYSGKGRFGGYTTEYRRCRRVDPWMDGRYCSRARVPLRRS